MAAHPTADLSGDAVCQTSEWFQRLIAPMTVECLDSKLIAYQIDTLIAMRHIKFIAITCIRKKNLDNYLQITG